MLILSRKINESIMVGEDIEIKVVDVSSRAIKLGIEAPKDIAVHRKEVFDAIKNENLASPQVPQEKVFSLLEYMKTKGER
ncbi:MAG: carbon storage regulator CsrA [Deferribacteraceae bacterium]|jgi:carbon storage regulator|nr:carbon storage regulator CsrA [Deferribacteraceae bacterium]